MTPRSIEQRPSDFTNGEKPKGGSGYEQQISSDAFWGLLHELEIIEAGTAQIDAATHHPAEQNTE